MTVRINYVVTMNGNYMKGTNRYSEARDFRDWLETKYPHATVEIKEREVA